MSYPTIIKQKEKSVDTVCVHVTTCRLASETRTTGRGRPIWVIHHHEGVLERALQ